jgi:hypothetical protein
MGTEDINAVAKPGGGIGAGQRVCTVTGAVAIEELVKGGGFSAICYDIGTRRYAVRAAKVVPSGRRSVVQVHTDKGKFDLTPEQPVLMQDGQLHAAGELTPGARLCACAAKPELGCLVTSADFGRERLDLDHLTEADCAVANWYPVPAVEKLDDAEVFKVEIAAGGAQPNVVIWTVGPGGGIGIVITADGIGQ